MSQMADGEDTGDGHSITPFNSEQQVNGQPGPSSLTMSLTDTAPDDIDAALKSVPDPKQNEPPKILPTLDLSLGDILVREKELQCNVFSPSKLEAIVRCMGGYKNIILLVCLRVANLENRGSSQVFQHQPKDIEYTRKIENIIMKHWVSSLDEILSEEKDLVFLRHFLDDILDSLDAEKVTTTGGISPDPLLAAVAAAPSCHRRANADELPAPIPYQ